jgi:DNA-directed RNA polymerase specialized sigma24 family protein
VASASSPEFEERASVRAWLSAIVIGVVRNHRRAARRKDPMRTSQLRGLEPDSDVSTRRAQGREGLLDVPVRPCAARAVRRLELRRFLFELSPQLALHRRLAT